MFDSVWAQLIQRLAGLFSSSTLRTLRNPSRRAVVPSAKAIRRQSPFALRSRLETGAQEPDEPTIAWLGPLCQLMECGLAQLLGYEPSDIGEKITYIRLNTPMPCPPRGTCPRSTARAPAASFIGDEPEQNLSRDATSQPMSNGCFARKLSARQTRSLRRGSSIVKNL